ncbi:MAG: acyl-CoA synthetase (AMP-forming)/AMP-acid ligase II [Paracoccaceae bacterium]|jgi:acyl-CoA synthetase (AMP-forming)/AMP-acid ligase II
MSTLGQLLSNAEPLAIAFRAPDKSSLNYSALCGFVSEIGGALRAAGVQRTDRVAIVLPNGVNMATAFLAVGNACIAAPLNPAYKADEFRFYINDLSAKLLITDDPDGPAAMAAKELKVAVAIVSTEPSIPAGMFTLSLKDGTPLALNEAKPADEALVLHTSGTTSRPKIVPLSQENITTSASNIAGSLALVPGDICMNIMPLFHIHGLIAAVLSSLHASASIYCTPGFNALKVYSWIKDASPTWYTAVPTMHQAILTRAARNTEVVKGAKLRLIRSSSASLPPQVMGELNDTFSCPVVEAYGMTEAAHQMTSNPIAVGAQKPGSVGKAAGPDVMLATETSLTDTAGVIGEIVIRGSNVTKGYEANEKANAENFFPDPTGDGIWFRTGDQGQFDAQGYLSIAGRLKEIINRGGEKISPREVDEILLNHPAIAEAVTFAVPHKQLGEDVAAAVVLREGHSAQAEDIRAFAAERLAGFKVPRQVLILDEIPKGSTGKVQRIGLHAKLGIGDSA